MKNFIFIGGEYECKSNNNHKVTSYLKKGNYFLTGRAAFNYIIQKIHKQYDVIYVPYFRCDSIDKVLKNFKIKIFFYDLDKNLRPVIKKEKKNSIVLIIDYFGIKNKFLSKQGNLIIRDISHSWVDIKKIPTDNNEIVYCSLRKHGIFSIGGWNNLAPFVKNFANLYLVKKIAFSFMELRKKKSQYIKNKIFNKSNQKLFLQKFRKLENSITRKNLVISSKFIESITAFKLKKIRNIRRSNFNFLNNIVNKKKYNLKFKKNETPAFFIVKLKNIRERNILRNKLIKNNIFCPIHWKLKKNIKFKYSSDISSKILSIPIDQRYNLKDMQKISYFLNC